MWLLVTVLFTAAYLMLPMGTTLILLISLFCFNCIKQIFCELVQYKNSHLKLWLEQNALQKHIKEIHVTIIRPGENLLFRKGKDIDQLHGD